MKTELEEAAKEFVLSHDFSQLTNPNHLANRCFKYGAKWQAEIMYSEEDMIEFAEWIANSKLHGYSKQLYEAMIIYKVKTTKDLLKVWFEKFKKK
jgi:hypothetical protein